MWQRLTAWLSAVPISDPVDRRNAVFMQWLLAFQGLRTPLIKIYLLASEWPYMTAHFFEKTASGEGMSVAIDLGTDLAMTVSAWVGFYLIRVGKFRQAVKQFLATLLISGVLAYGTFGYRVNPGDSLLIISLALGGLMLGRRALWTIYVSILLIFAAGMTADYVHTADASKTIFAAYSNLLFRTFSYALITIILDRSSGALREALAESDMHRRQLQHEMVERERTQEQLLHAQKMDAVGRLAQGVAHDFNNVLAVILGFSKERYRLDEPEAERSADSMALAQALLGVEMAARRADSISRKLLNFSRRDMTHVEIFDIAEGIRDVELMLRQLFPQTVHLVFKLPNEALLIEFDLSQFELAILNIASNARDAMPEGGTFEVAVVRFDSTTVTLVLADTGTGMPEETKARIFEPFFTTKPVGSGTGVGLTVVYNLIRNADGSIEVESEIGKGTVFRIRFPLAKALDPDISMYARGLEDPLKIARLSRQ
ncbi:histidine kinase [Dyella dinghuensis]|uniref:histidine kinase n=1 Tax=Dyella dinghuensis TaxID=1920169 RepID=A0A432LVI6_9GAMM|nr:ATP-binding protein [Dyella dinghuensis]RUL64534.1 histidine kinase [Dyella dinghuensis]